MKRLIPLCFTLLIFSIPGVAAKNSLTLDELKLAKRFGIGISGGGPLAVLGVEADVNITDIFSFGIGAGTGIDYSTFMMKGRWFLMGEWVSPYIGVSVARWWTDGTNATQVGPGILPSRFLDPGTNLANGFNVWLVGPTLGVQFMHAKGFAISAEVQYFVRLFTFSGGTYAGTAMHWYF